MAEFDGEYDFVVVGSGAGGLTAAITAHERGLHTLLVEKTDKIGGTSSYSGGGLWIPNNHVIKDAGIADSRAEGLEYMNDLISDAGDVGPASSPERKAAYLDEGPRMVRFLQDAGFRWRAVVGYPDYYPDRPGAKPMGRQIEGEAFDTRALGEWAGLLRSDPSMPSLILYNSEAADFLMSVRTLKGFRTAVRAIGIRGIGSRLRGRRLVTNGKSLTGQLLKLALDRGITIWRESPFVSLILDGDAVTGIVVEHGGQSMRIGARRGVLLAAGGFSRNAELRTKYQEGPVDLGWTLVGPGDTGDADVAAIDAGAATAMMERAWWMPTIIDPATKVSRMLLWERSLPHSIVVDSSGQRFVNEATSYLEFGNTVLERNRTVDTVPSWMIIDARHRRRYPFALFPPGLTPKSAITSGFLVKAATLDELAAKIGIDAAALRSTVDRFNTFALRGVDEDFGRGRTVYDNFYGDPRSKPNPNLGTIERAPFYATKVWPGDLGTKGGLLTDEHGQVLRENGQPIPGLYATGNTTATVMGDSYPGPGATIGPAMVFGYTAAVHAATTGQP
jgi:3-oxosteroid 1-dehydrogenase